MESKREIFAKEIVKAWMNGEPDGLLLIGLYTACGMTREQAVAEVLENQARHQRESV